MVEHPLLDWAGRFAYLLAKFEEREIELYAMDMVWLIAKRNYTGLTQPTKLYYRQQRTDTRSGKQIAEDLIKGLGGE